MTAYYSGHIKRADNGDVAIRTMFPEGETSQLDNMAWLVATPNIGARHTHTAEVELWADLYVVTAPEGYIVEQPGS